MPQSIEVSYSLEEKSSLYFKEKRLKIVDRKKKKKMQKLLQTATVSSTSAILWGLR